MANLEAIKIDSKKNAKALVEYLRSVGLLGDSVRDTIREYDSPTEEVLHNAALAADDLARRIDTL